MTTVKEYSGRGVFYKLALPLAVHADNGRQHRHAVRRPAKAAKERALRVAAASTLSRSLDRISAGQKSASGARVGTGLSTQLLKPAAMPDKSPRERMGGWGCGMMGAATEGGRPTALEGALAAAWSSNSATISRCATPVWPSCAAAAPNCVTAAAHGFHHMRDQPGCMQRDKTFQKCKLAWR